MCISLSTNISIYAHICIYVYESACAPHVCGHTGGHMHMRARVSARACARVHTGWCANALARVRGWARACVSARVRLCAHMGLRVHARGCAWCVRVCACVCARVCAGACACVCGCVFVMMCARACACMCACVSWCPCGLVCVHACTCRCSCTRVRVRAFGCGVRAGVCVWGTRARVHMCV